MKVDFSNTRIAFLSKSSQELHQAHFLFKTLASPAMVNTGKSLTKFALRLGLPIKGVIKSTVYRQFVGGESIEECKPAIQKLAERHVRAILDYSAEGKENEAHFDKTARITKMTIDEATRNPGIPLTVFKPTGMFRFGLLEKVNAKAHLSEKESDEWRRGLDRFNGVIQYAVERSIPIMVDAEETWIQDVIDELVEDQMRIHNREKALVFNTLQFYRWDRLEYLKDLAERARTEGFKVGIKIVRGAYMEKENERAEDMGYPTPIQPDKESADRDYNDALRFITDNIDLITLVSGTHNENSNQVLVDLMNEKGIDKNDERVWFAQLYGMSDHISFNLAHHGFNVVKYLPFGPVEDVMPYLFRRAEENTSVAGQTGRELSLIEKELRRRKTDND
ncbi:MAG: proline dehydrogenase family protein [Bacteroidota bacterium]|nr:proline dehydrogenase family protein [Bacteroidota bacterium]